jgi:hypothetical protein
MKLFNENLEVTVRHDLFECGGVFEGERKLTESERQKLWPQPQQGMTVTEMEELLVGVSQVRGIL